MKKNYTLWSKKEQIGRYPGTNNITRRAKM
jgi:hypothetical protein